MWFYMTYTGGALLVSSSSCEGDISPSDATGIDSSVYDDELFGVQVQPAYFVDGAGVSMRGSIALRVAAL